MSGNDTRGRHVTKAGSSWEQGGVIERVCVHVLRHSGGFGGARVNLSCSGVADHRLDVMGIVLLGRYSR